MRRDNIFWGGVLILLGMLFLLQTQNLIPSIVPYLWPLGLILVGGWIILGVFWRPSSSADEQFSVALGGAQNASFNFSHGAGQIEISGGAPLGQALVGSSAAGMKQQSYSSGDRLNVKIEAGASFIPFVGPPEGVWKFQLTQEVPVTLKVETGASQMRLDLTDVRATQIELETGASNTDVVIPAHGVSIFDLEAGVASVNIRVPEGTAARIRVKEGLTSLNVDTNRFPQTNSRLYQSANYEQATDRTDINVEAGLGSITIS